MIASRETLHAADARRRCRRPTPTIARVVEPPGLHGACCAPAAVVTPGVRRRPTWCRRRSARPRRQERGRFDGAHDRWDVPHGAVDRLDYPTDGEGPIHVVD
ncbi:MAG: hypothetical protein ACRDZ2_14900, partial [Ilumatobacteraceae bacterium]